MEQMMAEGRVSATCSECGSETFSLPNNPPHDDDVVTCAGCGTVVGKYGDIQKALMDAGKAEVSKIISNTFGKFGK